MDKKNPIIVGCPNPYSMAEFIKGKKIDWSKKKDDFDTIAESFSITKEGFLSNSSAILSPRIERDKKGGHKILSIKDSEKRLEAIFKKFARPQQTSKTAKADSSETIQQKRKKIINFLLNKEVSSKIKEEKIKAGAVAAGAVTAGATDGVYLPEDMVWKDKGYFFNEYANWDDIFQGAIGDCYFLSSLCSTAYVNSFLIKNVTGLRYLWNLGKQPETPWHAFEFYVPKNGYESTDAWPDKIGTTQTVVVSEEVLVHEKSNINYGVKGPKEAINGIVSGAKSELDACWPAVYEKAYSKFLERCNSDYPFLLANNKCIIHFGNPASALKEILHTEKVAEIHTDNLTASQIWDIALEAKNRPTCATVHVGKANPTDEYYLKTLGLYRYHVYSILGVYTADNKKYLIIRNPHGNNPSYIKNNPKVYHKNWSLNYGANPDDSYRGTMDIYRNVYGTDDPTTSRGNFLMELDEFKRVFDYVEYYTGPALSNTGTTSLVPAAIQAVTSTDIRYYKVVNKSDKTVNVDVKYTNDITGNICTWRNAISNLAVGKTATIDFYKRKFKAGTKVRLYVTIAGSKSIILTQYTYHPQATKTITYTVKTPLKTIK